jgi:hypothetical protein
MEETGILENPNRTSACYLALNQVDVLLYFRLEGGIVPQGVAEAPGFVVVPCVFHPVNPEHGGRIIDMEA